MAIPIIGPELIRQFAEPLLSPLLKKIAQPNFTPQLLCTELYHSLNVNVVQKDKTFRNNFSPDMIIGLYQTFEQKLQSPNVPIANEKKQEHLLAMNQMLTRFAIAYNLRERLFMNQAQLKFLLTKLKSLEMKLKKHKKRLKARESEEKTLAEEIEKEDKERKEDLDLEYDKAMQKIKAEAEEENERREHSICAACALNMTRKIFEPHKSMSDLVKAKTGIDISPPAPDVEKQKNLLQKSFHALERGFRRGGENLAEMKQHLTDVFHSLKDTYHHAIDKIKAHADPHKQAQANQVVKEWYTNVVQNNLTQWMANGQVQPHNQALTDKLVEHWQQLLTPAEPGQHHGPKLTDLAKNPENSPARPEHSNANSNSEPLPEKRNSIFSTAIPTIPKKPTPPS